MRKERGMAVFMKILIIAPHQDDEIIGCGGAIFYFRERGDTVYIQHILAGDSGIPEATPEQCRKIRDGEATRAAEFLGSVLLPNMGFCDRRYRFEEQLQDKLIGTLRQIQPDILFLPHREESDLEHRIVSKMGREASWLAYAGQGPSAKAPKVLYYEVWSNITGAQLYLDITPYIERKKKALSLYRSQMKTGWLEAALGRNAFRGTTLNQGGYCEVFTFDKLELGGLVE